MKNTAFTHIHEALGAKMLPFAGYNMPIQFSGINDEHETVRTKLGVFDVSHMGEIWVKGPQALEFIQYVTTNDASVLFDGKVQYSCLPNGKGGIVDDLLVYKVDDRSSDRRRFMTPGVAPEKRRRAPERNTATERIGGTNGSMT